MQLLLDHCSLYVKQDGAVWFSMLLAGIIAGFGHCASMCGPFVLSISNSSNALQKLKGCAALPYNFGRMTTYILLAFFASYLSRQILGDSKVVAFSCILLAAAGAMFIVSASGIFQNNNYFRSNVIAKKISLFMAYFVSRIPNKKSMFGQYTMGVVLGFLPCGVLYSVLMVVATISNPVLAVVAMLFFCFGTMPALFIVAFGGKIISCKWPTFYGAAIRVLKLINGLVLIFISKNLIT